MAQYRQSGSERFGVRSHDLHHGNGTSDHVSIGIRAPHKQSRGRRFNKNRRISIGAVAVILFIALVVTVLAFNYLSRDNKEMITDNAQDDDLKNDIDFLTNVTRTETFKVLKFGKGSVAHGRDSRYWDRDDRRRDEDYNEDVLEHANIDMKGGTDKGHVPMKLKNESKKFLVDDSGKGLDRRVGLYNEAGRDELKMYEAEYEASLKNAGLTKKEVTKENLLSDDADLGVQHEAVDADDEYDDGIDSHDSQVEEYNDTRHDNGVNINVTELHDEDINETKDRNVAEEVEEASTDVSEDNSSLNSQKVDNINANSRHASGQSTRRFNSEKGPVSKRRSKRHKFSGCQMKFLNSTAQLIEPFESRKFARFSLKYAEVEEKPKEHNQWEPRFAGHQSLAEREKSFVARDQKINCGFVKGPEGSSSTGFDLAEDDARFISNCHIAVVSCIFGNSDRLRTPTGKTVSRLSRKNVCFVMFMDEITLQTLSSEGQKPDRMGFIGLWKVVVVKNLPYSDMRRVGKVPKLLSHRLFPSARYSIWLDSKLRLQIDPLLTLEYFLWRKGHEYAISNHYDRHCVWEEVVQNKKLNKYNHSVIDQQFAFYQADGLKRFNASDPKKLLPSNVPEGSLIVRAHTPMSNLFSCLWFNEVDRFTPRDQLSFAYTYQKLSRMNPTKLFHLNMFKDCERRAIAKLYHHRSEEKRNIPRQATE